MATASTIAVTEGSGKLLDTATVTTTAGAVEREGVFIGDGTEGGNRATVNDSGELLVNTGLTQGLTDAELRASEVPMADESARNFLWRILQMLLAPLGYDKSLARYRGTTLIESGTVTTVTTVTGLTNINGRNGDMLINSSGNTAWALNVRARIT